MIKMIDLSYPINSLEPYYGRETLAIHYDTLYRGYVNNTNKVLDKLKKAREENNYENIKCLEKDLSFQASGVILHELFFTNMEPTFKNSNVSPELLNQINTDFESFDKFKNQFVESSKVVEGSGWNLLVWDKRLDKLVILQCEKHQNLTIWGCIPLLVLDMWEHSYFLQYQANRGKYIDAFWNIINWNEVNERFKRI